MTQSEFHRIVRRDYAFLAEIAKAEQLRQVGKLQERIDAEQNPVERTKLVRAQEDVDEAWAQLRLWLLDPCHARPDNLSAVLRAALSIAAKADKAWVNENGGRRDHARAVHWLGLIVIARDLRRAFPSETQRMAA